MSNNAQIEPQILQTTSFGDAAVSVSTPIAQITAQYGILDNVFTSFVDGSVSTIDSKFKASTGSSANGVAVVSTRKQVQYKAGQGIKAMFTALFDVGVADNTQFAGLQNSESLIGFGYNGSSFGIVLATGGSLSIQELTVTTPALGAENATVTINGIAYTVPLTSGTVNFNAYQIAVSLNAQVPGFDFSSNQDVVTCLGNLPELGTGSFLFSSASAVASWVEKSKPIIPTEIWTPIANWSVLPNFDINPSLGNVYKIQFQYLGFGGIKFFIEDKETTEFKLVHVIEYANTSTLPSVPNPIFRCGWATRNTGNTTDVSVEGASAGVFVEGLNVIHGDPIGLCHIQASVGVVETNIVALRNRMVLNDKPNRASINAVFLSLATDTSKTAIFEIWKMPETAITQAFEWQYNNETTSIAEYSTDSVQITGGELIGCFLVKNASSESLDLSEIIGTLDPQDSISISAKVSGAPASEMIASITWKEDK